MGDYNRVDILCTMKQYDDYIEERLLRFIESISYQQTNLHVFAFKLMSKKRQL